MKASRRTLSLILIPLALLTLLGLYMGGRYWWYRGYSSGTRTGIVRKVSVKGPPYCKYLSGEVVTSVAFGQAADIWEFSVDDRSSSNPLVKQLEDAERTGARVTLRYRQDLHSLYRCTPSEYFVTEVLP